MRRLFLAALLSSACIGSPSFGSTLRYLDIQAHIDGLDRLIIRDNTLQWHHIDKAAVGRHVGANSPTIFNQYTEQNGFQWIPDWPEPPPAEIRYNAFSSVLTGQFDPMPRDGVRWRLEQLYGRGTVSIFEQPSAANGYSLIVEFDDVVPGGSTFYGARIAPVPVPAGLALAISGLLGLVVVGRRKANLRPA